MNKRFDARLKMFEATDDVLMANEMEWQGYLPMVNAHDAFIALIANINSVKQEQETDLKGIAINKKEKRSSMADVALPLCQKVRAWANDKGDIIVYGTLHITRSMIMNGRGSDAQTWSQIIYDAADALPAGDKLLYGITAADLTALQGAIDAYKSVKVSPRVAVAGRKSDTQTIKVLMSKCSRLLERSMDNLMANFAGTQFYMDYKNARRIVDGATQKANLVVTVLSDYDGAPIAGALISGTDGVSHFEEMTDMERRIKRKDIHPEVWQLAVSCPNFLGANVEADIYPGDKEKVLVKLKPV